MKKVLLTGASGYIGKHILRELRAHGYSVRATVRSDERAEEIRALFPKVAIDFAMLDLEQDRGWEAALEGIDVLLHTASPFPGDIPKDPDELIRPAVDGTMRALNAAKAAGVKRVVLTSSTVAIYGGRDNDGTRDLTEADWTADDAIDIVGAYGMSKTRAERAAWDFVAQNPEIVLTTINPGVVMGAPMDHRFGTSLRLAQMALAGKFPLQPNMTFPFVDVRDVARMHVAAIDNAKTFGRRFAAGIEGGFAIPDMVAKIGEISGNPKLRSRVAPNWLIRALALVNSDMRQVAPLLTRRTYVSTANTLAAFGAPYIGAEETLRETVAFLQAQPR